MKCNECDFESDSQRLLEIHEQATHVQDKIVRLAADVKERRRHAKKNERQGEERHGF